MYGDLTDFYKQFTIGEVVDDWLNIFISTGIEFGGNTFRDSAYDISYFDPTSIVNPNDYKISFYPKNILSYEQANFIIGFFCDTNIYNNVNVNGDIENPKFWVRYLTFQCSISDVVSKYPDGTLSGRFIIQFGLEEYFNYIRDIKIKELIKE
jgi:hypothetical protein